MPATSLQQLFVEELRDIYDGEKRLLRALPKMAKAAGSSELQNAFTMHTRETERQVTRLEQVFRSLGEKPRGKTCDGIMGLVKESNHAMEDLDGPVLDAALIAGAQKVEHYEISTYGTLAYFAELLGEDRAKSLLGETLEEEKAADEKLNEIAKSDVNREALLAEGEDEENDEDRSDAGTGMMSGMRRPAASMGLGNGGTRRSSAGRSSGRSRNNGRARAGRRRK